MAQCGARVAVTDLRGEAAEARADLLVVGVDDPAAAPAIRAFLAEHAGLHDLHAAAERVGGTTLRADLRGELAAGHHLGDMLAFRAESVLACFPFVAGWSGR